MPAKKTGLPKMQDLSMDDKRFLAYQFMTSGTMNQKQVAQMLDVSEQTITAWKKEDDYDTGKGSVLKSYQIAAKIMHRIHEEMKGEGWQQKSKDLESLAKLYERFKPTDEIDITANVLISFMKDLIEQGHVQESVLMYNLMDVYLMKLIARKGK